MPRIAIALSAAVVGLALLAGAAGAAEFDVKMLNKGPDGTPMAFDPPVVTIAPGDTVHFIAADKGHDVASIKGMIPDGAEPFEGKISQDLTVTFTVPGVYGYKCKPHYALGMVGVVVVGDPVNLDAVKQIKQIGKAKSKFAELLGGL